MLCEACAGYGKLAPDGQRALSPAEFEQHFFTQEFLPHCCACKGKGVVADEHSVTDAVVACMCDAAATDAKLEKAAQAWFLPTCCNEH